MRWILNPLLCLLLFAPNISFGEDSPAKKVLIIPVEGEINPVLASFIKDEIQRAENEKFAFVILRLDLTGDLNPGFKHILNTVQHSRLPVVSIVPPDDPAPSLARTFLAQATHLVAMAADTRIGRTPSDEDLDIPLPPEEAAEQEKMMAEQTTLLRTLASRNGRKTHWIEDIIHDGKSFSATEAEKLGAIDLVADNLDTLLEKANGRKIKLSSGAVPLDTQNIELSESAIPEFLNAMHTLANPEITQWIVLAGITLLLLDFLVFGAVVPGSVGLICLILMLFSSGLISPPTAGWTFIVMALMLLVIEGLVVAMGLIAICGAVSLVFGILILMGHYFPELLISDTTILLAVSMGCLFSIALLALIRKLQKKFSKADEIELAV